MLCCNTHAGEDYNGRGACVKWTDKWAERGLPGGGQEQWGDKWREEFGDGKVGCLLPCYVLFCILRFCTLFVA